MCSEHDENACYAKLSAVLLVEHVLVAEPYGAIEFQVDCLALGRCGDLLPLQIYYGSSDPAKMVELRELLRPGNLLVVRDEALDVCERALRLLCPDLRVYEGATEKVRGEFANQKTRRTRPLDGTSFSHKDRVRGVVIECRILATRDAGAIAIATIETADGFIEAALFNDALSRYQSTVSELGFMEFFGKFEPEEGADEIPRFIVEQVGKI